MRVSLLLLLALAAVDADAATLSGRVLADDLPLPGCSVRVAAQTVIANASGEYTFKNLSAGTYEISFTLDDYLPLKYPLRIREGENIFPDVSLIVQPDEVVIRTDSPCFPQFPSTRLDPPACVDFDRDNVLIAHADGGDAAAVGLLHARFATTLSRIERHRIAAAILAHPDGEDESIWEELAAEARKALDLPDEDGDDGRYDFLDALRTAAVDRRSRPILLDALNSGDTTLASLAVEGLARQHDESSLLDIDRTLAHLERGDATSVAFCLAWFKTDAADQLAFKYLSDDERKMYLAWRKEQ